MYIQPNLPPKLTILRGISTINAWPCAYLPNIIYIYKTQILNIIATVGTLDTVVTVDTLDSVHGHSIETL